MRIAGVTWSSSVAGISVVSALPPQTSLAPLATASSISALQCSTVLMPITEPSTTGSGLRGSPSGRFFALSANFLTKSSAILLVDDEALGAHADLAAVGKAAEGRGVDRVVDVGIVQDHQRRLAAEFQHHRLQVLGAGHRDDPADAWCEPVKLTRRTAGCATIASTTAPASAGALVM